MEKALLAKPEKVKTKKTPHTETDLTPIPNNYNIRSKLVQEFTAEELEYFQKTLACSDFYDKPVIDRRIDEIELDENNQYKGVVPCLREFQHTMVTDKLGNEYYILLLGAGETAICADEAVYVQIAMDIPATTVQPASTNIITVKRPTEDKVVALGVKVLAADIAMQTLEPRKVAKGWSEVPQYVRVGIVANDSKEAKQTVDDLVTSIKNYETDRKAYPDPTKKIKFIDFPATCPCNMPDVYSKKPATIKCTNCQTIAHAECINNATKYTCAPCQITIDGVNWGQGHAPNSCPVDNTISHYALRASKQPNFLKTITLMSTNPTRSEEVRAFASSVLAAVANDSAKCHKTWDEVLKSGPPPGSDSKATDGLNEDGTWWGGTDERLYAYLDKDLSPFVRNQKAPCSGECSAVKKTKNNPNFIETPEVNIALTTRPVDYFNTKSYIYATEELPCTNSGIDRSCKGVVTYDQISTPANHRATHLVVRAHGALNGPEDFLKMPRSIKVSGTEYQLGMINMFDRYRNHFTSLHFVENQFVYYDGKVSSKRKFRRALPSDYKQNNILSCYLQVTIL